MARRKYHKDEDWWGANSYLASEIAWCADKLIKHQKGYPGVFDKRMTNAKIIKYSTKNEKRWRKMLIDIRDGFKLYVECNGDFHEWKDGKEATWRHKKLPDGNCEVIKTNDAELIVNGKKERKFKRAMGLFAKYYDHLWD